MNDPEEMAGCAGMFYGCLASIAITIVFVGVALLLVGLKGCAA